MKRIIVFFKSIIPTRKKFNSWAMPTRIDYIAFIFLLFNYCEDKIEKYRSLKDEVLPVINESNHNGDIIIYENKKEVIKNFQISFDGILKDIGSKTIEIDKNIIKKNIVININYTGFYKALNNTTDIVNYSGGYIVIKIDSCILNFIKFDIPSLGPAPKDILINQVEERFTLIFQKNINIINNRIEKCIKEL